MVSADVIRKAVGIIGNVISFGLFLSPVPTFIKIYKKRAVEDFSPVPYLATWLNCAVWDLYGMPFVSPNNFLVYLINGIGLAIETAYLITFLIYASREGRKRVLLILAAELAFIVLVSGLVVGTIHKRDTRTKVVGILAVIFGTCMYASPLSVMKMVIETKSVKYMPFTLSFASFANGICWTIYAFLPFDLFMIIPNGLGAFFGAVQLILYACYYRSTPKEDDEEVKGEVQMQGRPARAAVVPDVV